MVDNAQARYNKANLVNVHFRLNKKYDDDIIQLLQSIPNKQGYIKKLIRADIARKERKAKRQAEKQEERKTMIDVKYFDAAVQLMDDDIREEIHARGITNKEEFLREYEKAHIAKYGKPFEI